jgi:hypothetical protein
MKRLTTIAIAVSVGLMMLFVARRADASQISLSPANVIGFFGQYSAAFPASAILDHQTGTISELTQNGSYWLNSDNGPANAYIVIDLGATFHLGSFDLFNTHNAIFNDRGTGAFSIEASNSIVPGPGSGSDLSGTTVTLVSGTLLAASASTDPLAQQTFLASDPGSYRYIRFSPHTVATSSVPCCGANTYGLNELRAFDAPLSAVPEPATMTLLGGGLAVLGLLRKKRAA